MILAAGGGGINPDPKDHVIAHELARFDLGFMTFYFTNHIVMTIITVLLVVSVFSYVASRFAKKGDKNEDYISKGVVANLFEVICQYLREEVARPALGKATDKYIYYIWTTFFFILFANLLGIVPLGSILRLATGNPNAAHWTGTLTGNVSMTAALAVVAFFMIHYVGIRESGIKGWAGHFLQGPAFLWPLMIVLETMVT